MSRWKFAVLVGVAISVAVAAWPTATQRSTVNRVTVAVTAGNLDEQARIWDFAVAFHSKGPALSDELMDSATLVAPNRRAKPLAWEGDPPGSKEHRAGVLKFIAFQPQPKWIELHLMRPGEAKPRIFRWEFGNWVAEN